MIESGLANLYVRDMEVSIGFYAGRLGLEETFRTPATGIPEHVEFGAGGFVLGLAAVEAAARVHGVEATPGAAALALVFWCDDVDNTYAGLVNAGIPSDAEPHNTGNGNRNARVRDPNGTLVELVSKRG